MIILVGASASGKTEAAKELGRLYGIQKAITTTTRPKRVNEVDGVDYFFVSQAEFARRLLDNHFVEHASYANHYYGTGRDQIDPKKVLIVEPNGLHAFKALRDPSIVTFFLDVDEKTRGERMRMRGDKEEDIALRLVRDHTDFSKEKVGQTDFVLSSKDKNIREVAEEIYSLYQKTLKERGL